MTPPTTSISTNRGSDTRSVLASLRALMPNRPLGFGESLRLAELQANRLLQRLGCQSPPFSESLIADLPRIDVRRCSMTGSGQTAWSRGAWRIRINGAHPLTRQRFTLAHEFKHILDASVEDVIYAHLPKDMAREHQLEAICDAFAACLLMPKLWVKRAWAQGNQDLFGLAWRFEVSQQAMLIRLQTLGLVEVQPRCRGLQRLGADPLRTAKSAWSRKTYFREELPQRRFLARPAMIYRELEAVMGSGLRRAT